MFKRYIKENCKAHSTRVHSPTSLLSSFPSTHSFSGPTLEFSKASLGNGGEGREAGRQSTSVALLPGFDCARAEFKKKCTKTKQARHTAGEAALIRANERDNCHPGIEDPETGIPESIGSLAAARAQLWVTRCLSGGGDGKWRREFSLMWRLNLNRKEGRRWEKEREEKRSRNKLLSCGLP